MGIQERIKTRPKGKGGDNNLDDFDGLALEMMTSNIDEVKSKLDKSINNINEMILRARKKTQAKKREDNCSC